MVASLLEQAFAEVTKLPENEQEEIARLILDKISETRTNKRSGKPSLSLREMIEQTRRDIEEGNIQELDPDSL